MKFIYLFQKSCSRPWTSIGRHLLFPCSAELFRKVMINLMKFVHIFNFEFTLILSLKCLLSTEVWFKNDFVVPKTVKFLLLWLDFFGKKSKQCSTRASMILASFQNEERMQLKQLKNGNSEGRRLFNQKNKKVSTVFFQRGLVLHCKNNLRSLFFGKVGSIRLG